MFVKKRDLYLYRTGRRARLLARSARAYFIFLEKEEGKNLECFT
jgi:hypothetical protein